jgi:hypothetical protein
MPPARLRGEEDGHIPSDGFLGQEVLAVPPEMEVTGRGRSIVCVESMGHRAFATVGYS